MVEVFTEYYKDHGILDVKYSNSCGFVNWNFCQDDQHKYVYDFETLKERLIEAGFKAEVITRKTFGESNHDILKNLEYKDNNDVTIDLIVEVVKEKISS